MSIIMLCCSLIGLKMSFLKGQTFKGIDIIMAMWPATRHIYAWIESVHSGRTELIWTAVLQLQPARLLPPCKCAIITAWSIRENPGNSVRVSETTGWRYPRPHMSDIFPRVVHGLGWVGSQKNGPMDNSDLPDRGESDMSPLPMDILVLSGD